MSLAFIFPGQGSQSIGMLAELATAHPIIDETYAQASEVLGYDLWQITQDGPEEKLNATAITQPAMLAAGVAVWRVWQAQAGATPTLMAGHSLGEYTALVCSGALDFQQAIALVAERGRLMQEAVPTGTGAMAAILGLDDDKVIEVCNEAAQGEVVSAVNYNSPGQVVIAGNKSAVERGVALAQSAGAKRAIMLAVSVPSHCALMKEAADALAARLNETQITAPAIPVINNVDVTAQTDPDAIRNALARQLHNPVRWVETIQALKAQGAEKFIECGPGKVLAGLNKRIDRSLDTYAIFDSASLEKTLASFEQALTS